MKILIIGNGYDLNLGLKSSFGDFYSSFFKDENNEWDYNKIRDNIWSLLLFFGYIDNTSDGLIKFENSSPTWMDVEGFICDVLNNPNLLRILTESLTERTRYIRNRGEIISSSLEMQLHEIKGLVQTKRDGFGVNDIYSMLYDDLSEFEGWFMNYLDGLNMQGYAAQSSLLMGKMTNDFAKTYVISFNYTKLPAGIMRTNQVHGNLEEQNIIIGVDKTAIKNKSLYSLRFSKSWRQLSGVINNTMLPPKDDVDEIVVFGHSLGGQDYSYFHSLFNYCDIYSSKTKLTFLYADYHLIPNTKAPDILKNDEHRIKYIDSVYKLLNDYVEKTLGQKEADSFVTKIQLEGRLSVQEINEYWVKNIKN